MPRVTCGRRGCPNAFDISPARLARLKGKPTCSTACKHETMRGKGHWNYTGGAYVDAEGYRRVLTPSGYQPEHRVVAERLLKRPLRADERVQHKKGADRGDNSPANLMLLRVGSPPVPLRQAVRQAASKRRSAA